MQVCTSSFTARRRPAALLLSAFIAPNVLALLRYSLQTCGESLSGSSVPIERLLFRRGLGSRRLGSRRSGGGRLGSRRMGSSLFRQQSLGLGVTTGRFLSGLNRSFGRFLHDLFGGT